MPEQLFKSFDQLLREQVSSDWTYDRTMQALEESRARMDLLKAFATGNPGAPGGTTSDALNMRLLNLDSTLSSILFTAKHFKMFNWLNRVPSVNALYEWNRRERYGSARGINGFPEGGAPSGSTSAYTRFNTYVRYMGVRGGITHQLSVAGQMGGYQLDPVEEEHHNRTMQLLEMIERQVIFGEGSVLDGSGNTVNYDGIVRQVANSSVASTNIIDKQGAPMKFEDFEETAYGLVKTGKLTDFRNVGCFMSPFILSDLSKAKLATERKILGASNPDYVVGVPLAGYDTNYGRINFDWSIFFEPVEGGAPVSVADPGSGAAPTGVTATAANDAASKLAISTAFYYRVSAFNSKGESLATAPATATTSGAAQHITVAWTPPAPTGDPATTAVGYRLYRGSLADGSDARWVATLPVATVSYVDVNQQIPGAGWCFFFERSPENLVLAQMTPLLRYPLAVVNTTMEFLLLLYHTLVVKVPERMYIYKNVGRFTVA
jgi:hypothetical protein